MKKNISLLLCKLSLVLFALTAPVQAETFVRTSADPIKGEIINSFTRDPVPEAIVNASWVIESTNGDPAKPERRLAVQQVTTDPKGQFEIPGWPAGRKIPDGWRLKPGYDPKITVFSNGYYHGEFNNSTLGQGAKSASVNHLKTKTARTQWNADRQFLLRPFVDYIGQGMYAGPKWSAELTTWLYAIRTEITAYEAHDKVRAKISQNQLLFLLKRNCEVIKEIATDPVCTQTEITSIENQPPTDSIKKRYEGYDLSLIPPENDKPVKYSIQEPGISVDVIRP